MLDAACVYTAATAAAGDAKAFHYFLDHGKAQMNLALRKALVAGDSASLTTVLHAAALLYSHLSVASDQDRCVDTMLPACGSLTGCAVRQSGLHPWRRIRDVRRSAVGAP